jgi:hypothetical protein
MQANLLLNQIRDPGDPLCADPQSAHRRWQVGFMPQWIGREYIARRGGARFRPEQVVPARCPLLGKVLSTMLVEGVQINPWFLQVELQPEVGTAGYDAGARILTDFFHQELRPYLGEDDLDADGRRIIECCLESGTLDDYETLLASVESAGRPDHEWRTALRP